MVFASGVPYLTASRYDLGSHKHRAQRAEQMKSETKTKPEAETKPEGQQDAGEANGKPKEPPQTEPPSPTEVDAGFLRRYSEALIQMCDLMVRNADQPTRMGSFLAPLQERCRLIVQAQRQEQAK